MKKDCLFTQSNAVAALNRVEGFDPMSLARPIEKEGQEQQLYLDVKYRKLWFRLVHPLGKIVSRIVSYTESMAIVEAKIYLDKSDPEENFISNAYSQKFRSDDPNFGTKFLEMAETAAVGRALSDAGFGLQFADVGEENDIEQTEAGIPIPDGFSEQPQSGMMGNYYHQAQESRTMIGHSVIGTVPAQAEGMPYTQNNQWGGRKQQIQMPSVELDSNLPVEELIQRMSYEQAVQVTLSTGKFKGKTMGQVAMESPGTLEWYANSYQGNNHLIPAAARVILSRALPMAG